VSKRKKINESSLLVTQSNKLVESRYNLPLSEQRLILSMIAHIQPDDEDFKPYVISIQEFAEFLNIDKNSMYRACKKITKSLLTRVVEIKEKERLVQTNWVSSAEYIDGSGMVDLRFDPLLKPYLLQLKSGFTSCRLAMLLSFKSQYTMRFYMLLKQYDKLGKREINIAELRKMLGIAKQQYAQFTDLRKRVIIPAQQELKAKANLSFEFEEIKQSRKIIAIRFSISQNNEVLLSDSIENDMPEPLMQFETIIEPPKTPLETLLDLVDSKHRNKKTVRYGIEMALKKHDMDYARRNILYANQKAQKSYAGFLNQSLKEDWGQDLELETQATATLSVWQKMGFESEAVYIEHTLKKQQQIIQQRHSINSI
jgi:plasmid replication initiation protein